MLCGDHAVVPGRRDATWVRGFGFNRAVDEGSSLEVEPGRLAGAGKGESTMTGLWGVNTGFSRMAQLLVRGGLGKPVWPS